MPGHYTDVMGGAQYQVKLLIEHLSKNPKYEIYYLTRNVDSYYNPSQYRIVRINSENNPTSISFFSDLRSIVKILSEIKPDIIYQRVACAYTGVAAYYGKRNNCTTVWHISSDADVTPPDFRLTKNLFTRYLDRKILNYGIARIDKIIAQTNAQARLLDNYFSRKVDAVISNFHPLPDEEIDKSNMINVVWVANLKKLKQPDIFIKLARSLSDIPNVKFTMIGRIQGSSSWSSALNNSIDATPNLEYLGELPQKEVNRILANSHILVNTSEFEGFSNTFIQAWMREVPVISLHVNPDQLLDGERLGMCSGTFERLLVDVRTLILDNTKRERMRAQCRAYAYKNHSLKNIESIVSIIAPES